MKPVKPELIVTGHTLAYSQQPGVDAEEQTAVQRYRTQAPAGPGQAGVVNAQGSIPAIIEYKTTAGVLANVVKSSCAGCARHDVKAWRQFVAAATGPASSAESRQTIQTLRGRIMVDGVGFFDDAGEIDIERTLMSFGICRVLSDWVEGAVGRDPMHWPVVTSRDATCPTYVAAGTARMEVVTAAEPLGLFKARDLEARKIGAEQYDNVLFDAAGKSR